MWSQLACSPNKLIRHASVGEEQPSVDLELDEEHRLGPIGIDFRTELHSTQDLIAGRWCREANREVALWCGETVRLVLFRRGHRCPGAA